MERLQTLNFELVVQPDSQMTQSAGEFEHPIELVYADCIFREGTDLELRLSFWRTYRAIPTDGTPLSHGVKLHSENSPVQYIAGEDEPRKFWFPEDTVIPAHNAVSCYGVNSSVSQTRTMQVDLHYKRKV